MNELPAIVLTRVESMHVARICYPAVMQAVLVGLGLVVVVVVLLLLGL